MQRIKPSKDIVEGICGSNSFLLETVHNGLVEVPMHAIYPHLDFDELVSFIAGSRSLRTRNFQEFRDNMFAQSLYSIFSYVFNVGIPWVMKNNKFKDGENSEYAGLNPYCGKKLAARLERIGSDEESNLRTRLFRPSRKFISESKRDLLHRHKADTSAYVVLSDNFPRKFGSNPDATKRAFVKEITRRLDHYPTEYTLLPVQPYEHKHKEPVPVQADLFS